MCVITPKLSYCYTNKYYYYCLLNFGLFDVWSNLPIVSYLLLLWLLLVIINNNDNFGQTQVPELFLRRGAICPKEHDMWDKLHTRMGYLNFNYEKKKKNIQL